MKFDFWLFLDDILEWKEEHPWKTMFFIQLPMCAIVSVLATKLIMSLLMQ